MDANGGAACPPQVIRGEDVIDVTVCVDDEFQIEPVVIEDIVYLLRFVAGIESGNTGPFVTVAVETGPREVPGAGRAGCD